MTLASKPERGSIPSLWYKSTPGQLIISQESERSKVNTLCVLAGCVFGNLSFLISICLVSLKLGHENAKVAEITKVIGVVLSSICLFFLISTSCSCCAATSSLLP